ncbi:Probable aquaporin PIP1-2 [Dionaea muscipula]
MEDKEEDVKLGANKFSERQPIGTAAQTHEVKDYKERLRAICSSPASSPPGPSTVVGIAEFIATFLFLYITISTKQKISKKDEDWQ